jgi:hypothetical protein
MKFGNDPWGGVPLLQDQFHKRDFYAGGLMTLLGAGVTSNALSYNTGTLMHMGPGMFPFLLGVVLTFIGVMIFITALATPLGIDEHILPKQREWRGWACIILGPVLFIVFGHFFGMAPATFMCVAVSAMGDRTSTFKESVLLGIIITIPGCLLFSYVLKLPFPLFRWVF